MSGTTSAATSPSVSASASVAAAPQFDHNNLVFNVDVFILCVVAFLVLLALPRAAIRFTHPSQWTAGHFLRSVAIHVPKGIRRHTAQNPLTPLSPAHISSVSPQRPPDLSDGRSEKSINMTEDEHLGPNSRSNLIRNQSQSSAHANLLRNTSTASGRVRRPYHNPPVHMPGWSSMLPRIAALLRYPLQPEMTVGKALVLIGYTVVVLYAGLYKSNPFTQPIRAGFVAISQVPVVIILGTKNNILGMMLGIGYERLNYLHRFAGLLLVLATNVHAIGYFYSWSLSGKFLTYLKTPTTQAGLVALIASDIFLIFSTSFWRQRFYNLFIALHVVSIVVFLVGMRIHSDSSVPYILVAVAAYGLDRVLRLVKTRYTVARLSTIDELGMTRIEVSSVNAGWRAGQHVRIRVLSRAMGWFAWLETHPFSIVSVSKGFSEEGLVLMCKKTGTWTTRLYELARRAEYGEAGGYTQDVRLLVEGPYGGPGHMIFASFSGALLVAGGSGVTFALGAFQELIQKDLEGESRLKAIELVWSVPDPASVIPFLPLFTDLLSLRTFASLKIHVFYTRAPTSSAPLKTISQLDLPSGFHLSPGRPRLAQLVTGVLDQACALSMFKRGARRSGINASSSGGGLTGVVVGVCGPAALVREVKAAVRSVDPKRRKTVGGIEVHEEVFGQ